MQGTSKTIRGGSCRLQPLKRRPNFIKIGVGFGLLASVVGELTVVGDAPGDKQGDKPFRIRQTSLFKYYGKPKGEQPINASAVVLKGGDLCWPDADVVKGKIVVGVRENVLCDLEESYIALDKGGAVAFVSIVTQRRSGLFCFRHMSWNRQALADNSLVLVEVTKKAFVDVEHAGNFFDEKQFVGIIDDWTARAKEGTLRLLLSPPWDTFYQDYYESWWRTLLFQVLLPCYALYASVLALLHSLQYYRKAGGRWTPGRVICFMEAPIMFLIAGALACGLYGPDLLPSYFFILNIFLYSAFGHTTSIIVVLFVRQSKLDLQKGVQRSNVCKVHRRKLIAFLIVGQSLDWLLPRLSFYLGNARVYDLFVLVLGVLYFLTQAAIGVAYTYQTSKYVAPIQDYIRHPDSNPRTEHVAALRSLVLYLRISIFAMVTQTVSMLCAFLVMRPRADYNRGSSSMGLAALGVFAWSRITVSYCQIKSIAPLLEIDLAAVYRALRCLECCTGQVTVVPTQWVVNRLEAQTDLMKLAPVEAPTVEIKSPCTRKLSGEVESAGEFKVDSSGEFCSGDSGKDKVAGKLDDMIGSGCKRSSRSGGSRSRSSFSSLSSASRESLPSIDERSDEDINS